MREDETVTYVLPSGELSEVSEGVFDWFDTNRNVVISLGSSENELVCHLMCKIDELYDHIWSKDRLYPRPGHFPIK